MAIVTPLLTSDTFRTWLTRTNTAIDLLNSNTVIATINAVGAFAVSNTTDTTSSLTIYHATGGQTLANSTGLFLSGNTTFSGLNFTANATCNVFTVSSNTTLLESLNGTTINSDLAASKTLIVTGAATFSNTLALTGTATFSSNVSIAHNLTVSQTLNAKMVLFSETGAIVSAVLAYPAQNDRHNYSTTGLAEASILRINVNTNNMEVTGILAPTNLTPLPSGTGAKVLYLQNIGGTYKLTLKHADTGSDAENRFVGVGNADVVIPAGGAVTLLYTVAESRWRVLAQVEPHVNRTQVATNVATVTPNADENDLVTATNQSQQLTINNPSPAYTVVDGQKLILRIRDAGYVQSLLWGTQYRAIQSSLPGATIANKTLYMGFIYNAADTKWDLVANAQQV